MRAFVAVLFVVLASGCSGRTQEFPEASTPYEDGAFVSTSATIEIADSEYRADRGTLTVLEHRSTSGSRCIHLPVVRIRSRSTTPHEPIFFFAGGPGQSNLNWNWEQMSYLLAEHDLVTVGYRGVDGSTVLDCPEVAQTMAGSYDPLSDESMDALRRAWERSARRLSGRGIDLDGYTMLEVIEDNEAACRALGYNRINLLSGSYGTRIAYLYGLKYPDRIHRSAMICANPPGHLVWKPEIIDRQLRRYSALWARDPVMAAKSRDLYADMKQVLMAMPRSWLRIPINPGKVKTVTFALLFQRSTASMVFDAYVAARHGDPSGLALMSVAYDYVVPTLMVWGDLAAKAVSADYDSTRNYRREMDSTGSPLGSPLGKLLWGPQEQNCWPTSLLPGEFRRTRHSAVPTLILSGSNDFSTPAEHATLELLPNLPNGSQVVLSECGHFDDIMTLDPENTRRLLEGFYKNGVPDSSRNAYMPMDFSVRWGFPAIAKAAVGTIAVLVAGLIALLVWILRRVW